MFLGLADWVVMTFVFCCKLLINSGLTSVFRPPTFPVWFAPAPSLKYATIGRLGVSPLSAFSRRSTWPASVLLPGFTGGRFSGSLVPIPELVNTEETLEAFRQQVRNLLCVRVNKTHQMGIKACASMRYFQTWFNLTRWTPSRPINPVPQ